VTPSPCFDPGVSPARKPSSSSIFGLAAVALLFGAAAAQAASVSPNTGSLGAAGNGTNADAVTTGPGAVGAGADQSAVYNGTPGTNTIIPFQQGLNPASTSPFSIEFWARPTASDNDDAPVSNRISTGDRSGWAFFQRAAATGWNFRMYNGIGSGLGWDLTGGTSNLDAWNHVVATWNGSSALLYVNGVLADSTNDAAATGGYNASSSASFIVGSTDSASALTGSIDETAFYNTALTPAQILSHFNTISSPTAGAYHSLVRSDGALLQLSNNEIPEPSGVALLGAGAALLLRRRRASRRQG
jgi:hypothetical protein